MSDDAFIDHILSLKGQVSAYGQEVDRLCGEIAKRDAEIARLRARVDALRWPLAVYIHALASGSNVPPHIEAAARAALKEAKP